jgi:hypothetical protein
MGKQQWQNAEKNAGTEGLVGAEHVIPGVPIVAGPDTSVCPQWLHTQMLYVVYLQPF